jgi:4-amino-4-deoxy-L-arabinose transferase-like glycosyltransferase
MYRESMLRVRTATIRDWPIVALLALFGVVYSTALDSYGMFMWDEAEYASIARSIVQGQGFAISGRPNALRPPILPLAGATSMLITGDRFDDSTLRAVNCGFALLALLCVYGFAAAAFDRTVGVVAAALLGMSPFFWTFVPFFMCEIPFMAFFAAAVWCFYFGAYRDERFFPWSWICWALAFLTRYTASLFLPVIVVFIPIALWLGGPATRRRFMSRTFFLSPLAGLLVLAPWLIRQYVTFGSPLAGLKQASQQLQVYATSVSMPWDFYLDRLPSMLSPAIAVLFLAGVVLGLSQAERFALHAVLATAIILVWFSCYRYKEERLVSSALPFMTVIAAIALTKAAARLRPWARVAALGAVLTGIFILNLRATRPVFEGSVTLGYPSFLEAMIFLREHATPGAVVLGANYPQIDWYSGLRAIDFPQESSRLQEALRLSEWVVITNFERGQKPYVSGLIGQSAVGSPESAAQFHDGRYTTAVIRSNLLLRHPTR